MTDFVTSDPHYSHANICTFMNNDGSKVRPWTDVNEMNEAMVERHNKAVRPNDKVYFLGDIAFHKKYLTILERLNGKKVLIKGNHDIEKITEYLKYFYDIRGVHIYNKFCMSHIPIHPDSLGRFTGNIHGHLHNKRVMLGNKIDHRYISACVEHHNYTPISFEELQKQFIAQQPT